jgi:hypothetical protein
MAMKALKLAATLLSTLVLVVVGATSAQASTTTPHGTFVSGVEFYATSTEGRFSGTATGRDPNGLWGAWGIVVNHTVLDSCWKQSWTDPCAQVTGGTFSLQATTPALITGNFTHQGTGVDGIVLGNAGANCTTQLFRITDSLNSVGTGSQHSGTGTFVGYLWHLRHWVFGRCVTYSATVQGTVVLNF